MKILHVIRDVSPRTGGPVSAIRGLMQAQRDHGDEVRVITTDYGLPEGYVASDGEVICECTLAAWRYAPSLRKELEGAVKWADIVHIHTVWEYPTLIAARMAKKMNKPFLLRPCGMLDAWSMSQSALKKKLYLGAFSKALFAPECLLHFTTEAEKSKSIYPQHLDSIVVENGISEKAFSVDNCADDFLNLFPVLKGKDIVLFLGRVDPKKQPEIALKAFAKLASDFPNACLVIAGPCEPAYQATLMALVEQLNIQAQVLFTGMLQGLPLYGAFRAAKVFVLPSFQENFGIAVAESMANYCPVIVSENVDIKDYIQKGKAGIVCLADVESFTSAIKEVLADPQGASIMGSNGREVVEQFFRWSTAAERLDKIYHEMIRRRVESR